MKKLIPWPIYLACFLCAGLKLSAQPYGCQVFKNAQAPIYYSAENLRSDTFDLLKLTVNLEIGNTTAPGLKGNAVVRFAPKLNNRTFLRLDLLKLIVDSVKENNAQLAFTYNDTILKINFNATKNIIDTSSITVYYHGTPIVDATGWGGFYFDNTQGAEYAFNLGVGFGARPHNYGRTWFPCFDNFVEKCRYEFNITSDPLRQSFCNGALVSDVTNGGKRTRKWIMSQEIPSYLASVALADYTQVNWTVNTLTGTKPIVLAANAADTTALKAGFVNLKSCIAGFENYYGPYVWNRFGYCVVPFSSGAMEHATNISYPQPFIGSLQYESDLMAHELSHHWWGDLVTCETAEDMWINEGMATFSSYMFLEWQYGKKTYLDKVKTEHEDLLHFLHKKEGGFRAISGVPHNLTYGSHVYTKGADVAHTLRGYMGDSAFFAACKNTMSQKAYKNMNSSEMKTIFQASTGQNLSDFFNNWVFAGGWPHFAVDSVRYTAQAGNSVTATVYIKQKLYGASAYYNNVPLEISFFKADRSRVARKVTVSGPTSSATVSLPFAPVMCALNYDSKISDATSHEAKALKAPGNVNYGLGKALLKVQSAGADSSLIRVVHNYVKPDSFKSNPGGHRLSNQHFWKIEGIISPGFLSKVRFNYDGSKALSGSNAYLDTLLTIVNGDSVGLFYRPDAASDWIWLRQASKIISNSKTGSLEIDSLMLGEYTFGNVSDTSSLGVAGISGRDFKVALYPNPAGTSVTVDCPDGHGKDFELTLYDIMGKKILQRSLNPGKTKLDIGQLPAGAYPVKVSNKNGLLFSQNLLIQ